MTVSAVNETTANILPHSAWNEFNDVISDISQVKSLVGCADTIVRYFDDLNPVDEKIRMEYINRILALMDSMNCKLENVIAHAERVFEMIFAHK